MKKIYEFFFINNIYLSLHDTVFFKKNSFYLILRYKQILSYCLLFNIRIEHFLYKK